MERLRKHAGRTAAFHVGPVTLAFTIQTTGEVTHAVSGATSDLDVRISPFLLPRLAAREEAALREIDMQGDMELAQEISFIARNLDWDVEEDLSKVIGDIAAHRAVAGAKAFFAWGRDVADRPPRRGRILDRGIRSASRVKVEGFLRTAELRDAIERLEKRIEKSG
jgi:ubiquinone biosynthesis protein UbiJ